jgi:SPP1 family predicted phage head-tail adaptor
MLFRDVVNLISVSTTENDMGDIIEIEKSRQVFANKKSVTRAEFYQAAVTDLRPELMFEVRSIEYENEKKLKFNNKTYNIIRIYSKNDELTELVCQGLVGE